MAEEIIRRREMDGFECDSEGYERLRRVMEESAAAADSLEVHFSERCFLCYCRRYWKMN